jgi:hypothetical protein
MARTFGEAAIPFGPDIWDCARHWLAKVMVKAVTVVTRIRFSLFIFLGSDSCSSRVFLSLLRAGGRKPSKILGKTSLTLRKQKLYKLKAATLGTSGSTRRCRLLSKVAS